MQFRRLGSTGLTTSILGFGASPLGNVFEEEDPAETTRAVHLAIDLGINFFDVSPYYGATLAEARLGEALAGSRSKVILATKCGRNGADDFDFSAARVKMSVDASLRRLQTDYVDVLQAHDIEFGDATQIVEETIPALRAIQQQGKARFIGITGYQLEMLVQVAGAAGVDTVLSYCRFNLFIDDMDSVLTPAARSRDIGLVNASPLHMGILSPRGAPDWHPAPAGVKEAGRAIVAACNRRGVSASALAVNYCLGHPYVSSTLVGMATSAQVRENIGALHLEFDPELLAEIQRIVAPVHNTVWRSGKRQNADCSLDAVTVNI